MINLNKIVLLKALVGSLQQLMAYSLKLFSNGVRLAQFTNKLHAIGRWHLHRIRQKLNVSCVEREPSTKRVRSF